MGKNEFQKELVKADKAVDLAYVRDNATGRPQTVIRVKLDLSVARSILSPLLISCQFKSVYVETASDVYGIAYLKPNTQEDQQEAFALSLKDSWAVDHPVSKGYLHWPAQAGKTMEILFFTDSQFRSGSQISVTGGGVSIVEGSSFTQSALTFVAATALQIFAVNSSRKIGNFQNKTGGSVWVGGASVTNTAAFYEVLPGADFTWRNTAALYGYSFAGGTGHKTEEL